MYSEYLTKCPFYSEYLIGMHNCSWTSCTHGCTSDVVRCWRILVTYQLRQVYTIQYTVNQPMGGDLTN